jgi:hypothetical protein
MEIAGVRGGLRGAVVRFGGGLLAAQMLGAELRRVGLPTS